jgi:hypothetical protein
VNVSGASRKNKAAVNRAAVSKADDKTGCSLGTSFFIYVQNILLKAKPFCYATRRNNKTRARR